MPEELIIRLVKEQDGRFRTRYSEYFPGSIIGESTSTKAVSASNSGIFPKSSKS